MKKLFILLCAAALLLSAGCVADSQPVSSAPASSAAAVSQSAASISQAYGLKPESYADKFASELTVSGYSLAQCGLWFEKLDMMVGIHTDNHNAHYTGMSGMYYDTVLMWQSESSELRGEYGHNATDRLEVFTGRDPIFYGSLDLIEYGDYTAYNNTFSPMAILQVFKKSEIIQSGARLKIGYYDSTYNTFVKTNKTGSTMPAVELYYIDAENAAPFLYWENDEYIVYDWLPLFMSVSYDEWLTGLEPIETLETYPIDAVVAAHRAAKLVFDADNLITKAG